MRDGIPFALVFGVVALSLVVLAINLGPWAWLLLWPALNFALLGAAYAGLGARTLGKQRDGSMSLALRLLFVPLLGLLWFAWQVQRLCLRENICDQIVPGLWLGRRPYVREIPSDVVRIVDLTSEFPAARGLTSRYEYLSLPTLDGLAPEPTEFLALLERLRDASPGTYLHCAMGHGRSAAVAAGLLLVRGVVTDVKEAEAFLRARRPAVRLTPAQRRLLRRLFPKSRRTTEVETE